MSSPKEADMVMLAKIFLCEGWPVLKQQLQLACSEHSNELLSCQYDGTTETAAHVCLLKARNDAAKKIYRNVVELVEWAGESNVKR